MFFQNKKTNKANKHMGYAWVQHRNEYFLRKDKEIICLLFVFVALHVCFCMFCMSCELSLVVLIRT